MPRGGGGGGDSEDGGAGGKDLGDVVGKMMVALLCSLLHVMGTVLSTLPALCHLTS